MLRLGPFFIFFSLSNCDVQVSHVVRNGIACDSFTKSHCIIMKLVSLFCSLVIRSNLTMGVWCPFALHPMKSYCANMTLDLILPETKTVCRFYPPQLLGFMSSIFISFPSMANHWFGSASLVCLYSLRLSLPGVHLLLKASEKLDQIWRPDFFQSWCHRVFPLFSYFIRPFPFVILHTSLWCIICCSAVSHHYLFDSSVVQLVFDLCIVLSSVSWVKTYKVPVSS